MTRLRLDKQRGGGAKDREEDQEEESKKKDPQGHICVREGNGRRALWTA
jgi:hypothetical protein